jgi:DNA-binding phage protein
MKERDPLLDLVFRKCGNMSNLARKLGLTRQAISKWDRVPLAHIKQIADLTGMTRESLRPDIYS